MKTAANTTSTRWQNIRYSERCTAYVQAIEAHPLAPLVKLGALADKCAAGCKQERPEQWVVASMMLDTLESFDRAAIYF